VGGFGGELFHRPERAARGAAARGGERGLPRRELDAQGGHLLRPGGRDLRDLGQLE